MDDGDFAEDRISSLPDDVRTHILSFVTTKEAVQTCILSTRWKDTWLSVPVLNINFKEFETSNHMSCEQLLDCDARFVRFVNGVLQRRQTSRLDKFQLINWRDLRTTNDATKYWLDQIKNSEPRVLTLVIGTDDEYDVLDSVFNCTSLEVIKIELFENMVDNPQTIRLPCLKKLELSTILFGKSLTDEIFRGCPALEELVLRRCDVYSRDITSSTLKHLAIINCSIFNTLLISVPNVVYLCIRTFVRCEIVMDHMPYLVNAEVHFEWPYDITIILHEPNYRLSVLSNATELDIQLLDDMIKAQVEIELPNFPTFYNLKKLKIGLWCMSDDFDLVAAFLEHSPNLENLILCHSSVKVNPNVTRISFMLEELFKPVTTFTFKIKCCYRNDESVNNLVAALLHYYIKECGEATEEEISHKVANELIIQHLRIEKGKLFDWFIGKIMKDKRLYNMERYINLTA